MMGLSDYFYNDIGNLPIYTMFFAFALIILGISIFFHELGHMIYFKLRLKKTIKIKFIADNIFNWRWEAGNIEDYKDLTEQQYKDVMAWGVMLGAVPIIVSSFIWFPFLMLLVPYGIGSLPDFREMTKDIKIEDE